MHTGKKGWPSITRLASARPQRQEEAQRGWPPSSNIRRLLWSLPSLIDLSAVNHCPCARAYVSCQNIPESKRCRLISVDPASPMRLQNCICSDSSSVGTLQVKASLIPPLVETIIFWDISSPKLTHLFRTFPALGFRLVPLKLNICHVSIASK